MCRCLLRARGHAARLTLISQSMNVASIVSRRAELAGLGDLIKPSMIPLILPGARILPDKSCVYRIGERITYG